MNWNKIIPRWEGTVVEPPEQKKTDGFEPGDRPPAFWENWFRKGIQESVTENREEIEVQESAIKGITGKPEVTDTPKITLEQAVSEVDFNDHLAEDVTNGDSPHGIDYEEGIWIPALTFGGVATGISYVNRTGKYIKNGKSITCFFQLELGDKGTATGIAEITGLPFLEGQVGAFLISDTLQFVTPTGARDIFGLTSSSKIILRANPIAVGANINVDNTHFTNATRLRGYFNYISQ